MSKTNKSRTGDRISHERILYQLTGLRGWKASQGPDSGCGVDYWYKNGSHEAYINVDQEEMTVSVDGEVLM